MRFARPVPVAFRARWSDLWGAMGILDIINLAIAIAALIMGLRNDRLAGRDERFEGERLNYRS